MVVDTQWRVAAFSVVGLDLPAIMQIAEIFEIPVDKALIQKVKLLERYELKRAAQKEENRSGK